jgi:hypothetical protein
MTFTLLFSLCGAGFALLQLLAPATALPIARSTSSSTLVALREYFYIILGQALMVE